MYSTISAHNKEIGNHAADKKNLSPNRTKPDRHGFSIGGGERQEWFSISEGSTWIFASHDCSEYVFVCFGNTQPAYPRPPDTHKSTLIRVAVATQAMCKGTSYYMYQPGSVATTRYHWLSTLGLEQSGWLIADYISIYIYFLSYFLKVYLRDIRSCLSRWH